MLASLPETQTDMQGSDPDAPSTGVFKAKFAITFILNSARGWLCNIILLRKIRFTENPSFRKQLLTIKFKISAKIMFTNYTIIKK